MSVTGFQIDIDFFPPFTEFLSFKSTSKAGFGHVMISLSLYRAGALILGPGEQKQVL